MDLYEKVWGMADAGPWQTLAPGAANPEVV